ncbi:hypothetical protein EV646_112193 [Kribbella antiqua]|uniref:DUF3761 domain-containing protein n=1 Tax=Kribbella antiqua TaxID=2512217 RepID=A0A4R2IHA3_9ACTN|nr:hypothetical protein EV646_112193 [Kribbella antiqua]
MGCRTEGGPVILRHEPSRCAVAQVRVLKALSRQPRRPRCQRWRSWIACSFRLATGRDDGVEFCKGDDRSPYRPSGSARPSDRRKLGNIANPRLVDLAAPEQAVHGERLAVVSCADSIAADRENDTTGDEHSRTDEVAVSGGFEPQSDAEPDHHAAGQHVGDARDQQRSKFHDGNGASRRSTPRARGARRCRRTPNPLIIGRICSALLTVARNPFNCRTFGALSSFGAASRLRSLPVESRPVSRPLREVVLGTARFEFESSIPRCAWSFGQAGHQCLGKVCGWWRTAMNRNRWCNRRATTRPATIDLYVSSRSPYRCFMGYRFNPPPNWPAPPPGWTPPPDWRPDPAWPPPPPGWALWVPDDTASPSSTTPPKVPHPGTPGSEDRPVGRSRGGYPNSGRAAPTQPLPQRVRRRFRTLPMWAKILVILLLIGLLPWLLIVGGLGVAGIGIVGLVRGSLPRFRVASRASATGALLLGLVGVGAGSALAAAVLSPAPPATTGPPVAAPTTSSVVPTLAPTTPVPQTTAHPPASRPPATVAPTKPTPTRPPATIVPRKPATTRPPKASPPPPATKPALCGAPANPYGYNFCGRGGYVRDPPLDVCSYFDCIPSFWNGTGYMEECQDGTYSMSGGRSGSCSHHGGNRRVVSGGP